LQSILQIATQMTRQIPGIVAAAAASGLGAALRVGTFSASPIFLFTIIHRWATCASAALSYRCSDKEDFADQKIDVVQIIRRKSGGH
jgi:hypothetical protein